MSFNPLFPDEVDPAENAVSASSLALAPWVEEQARPLRAAHIQERAQESNASTAVKVSKWNRGVCRPREGSHRKIL